MTSLPPPQTFAEGQRYIYGLLAAAAGIFCGLAAVGHGRAADVGRLERGRGAYIVIIFGFSLGGFIAAMVVVIVGLLAGGPVGRFKVEATREGASFEAESKP